jgi:CRISPR system Cascade subunit CasE
MYISQIVIPTTDTYKQHKYVWSLFSMVEDRKRDHLFRVETSSSGRCVALLQSPTQPKATDDVAVVNSKEYNPVISKGLYKFKVTANPSKRCNESRKILDLSNADEQIAWLQRKFGDNNVTVSNIESNIVKIKTKERARFVTFEGVVSIANPDHMYGLMMVGIGRKKHAGAGLITLTRLG